MREIASDILEASSLIQNIGSSCEGTTKEAINYAARRLKWTCKRVKDIWYRREDICIRAREMDQLRALAPLVERERAVKSVVALRRSLARGTAGMDHEAIAALDTALRALGEPVCAVEVSPGRGEG